MTAIEDDLRSALIQAYLSPKSILNHLFPPSNKRGYKNPRLDLITTDISVFKHYFLEHNQPVRKNDLNKLWELYCDV
jgi:hypothetical protein